MRNWFQRFFERRQVPKDQAHPRASQNAINAAKPFWIPADQNPWKIPIVDVRPVTQTMISASKNPLCASNAISFSNDDGTGFIGIKPASSRSAPVQLQYPIERFLADGALFVPSEMEHKWAIYFHRGTIIFIRSWMREVVAVANVEVADQVATITRIDGSFADETEDAAFSARMADSLIRTHALKLRCPVPLPAGQGTDPESVALGAMSYFGKIAEFVAVEPFDAGPAQVPLRSYSLLHMAVARENLNGIQQQLEAGVPADLRDRDGLSPLHWAVDATENTSLAGLLLAARSPIDVASDEGATPLMAAVQKGSGHWLSYLLTKGADPNAADRRGFTSLHRAAEMGKIDLVRDLVNAGARPDLQADGHTATSLAQGRKEVEIVRLLTSVK